VIIILDSGIVYTICNSSNVQGVTDCQEWFYRLMARSAQFAMSEICDYEVRRELIRRNQTASIKELDELRPKVTILPITQQVLLKAAQLWATARQNHNPTSDDENIDIDMILSAQYLLLKADFPGQNIVVATTNTKHLRLFTTAEEWENINL